MHFSRHQNSSETLISYAYDSFVYIYFQLLSPFQPNYIEFSPEDGIVSVLGSALFNLVGINVVGKRIEFQLSFLRLANLSE